MAYYNSIKSVNINKAGLILWVTEAEICTELWKKKNETCNFL